MYLTPKEKPTGQELFQPPDMTIDLKKKYTTTFKLDKGDIVVELFADKAPTTVNKMTVP